MGCFFDWVPCLISFWLADILLGVLLGFSLFLGSSFLWCCFLPFFLLPLALRRSGGIVVDWCSGRTKSSTSSQGGHPSPSRSSSPAVPPFSRRRGAWEACSLFEPPLVSRWPRLISLAFLLFSSLLAFGPLALRRKGGIVVDWCSGRTKSSASSEGGHPSPSRSPSPAVPPLFAKARGWGSLFPV